MDNPALQELLEIRESAIRKTFNALIF